VGYFSRRAAAVAYAADRQESSRGALAGIAARSHSTGALAAPRAQRNFRTMFNTMQSSRVPARSRKAHAANRSPSSAAESGGPRLSAGTVQGGIAKRRLYRRLLGDILHGRLPPDQALCLRDLARDYGTSTTSVRQVLIELIRDRLVSVSETGYEVAAASQTELLELTQTAFWLGEIGLRESIRRGDRQWEENVLRTCRAVDASKQPAAEDTQPASAWEHMLAFHEALVSACHSSILAEQCRSLNERLWRYRNLAAAATGRDHQHRDSAPPLRDAALARDAVRATDLLRAHYRATEHGILASGILR
jgi:DNA-binding GntR family transcriptional regulator